MESRISSSILDSMMKISQSHAGNEEHLANIKAFIASHDESQQLIVLKVHQLYMQCVSSEPILNPFVEPNALLSSLQLVAPSDKEPQSSDLITFIVSDEVTQVREDSTIILNKEQIDIAVKARGLLDLCMLGIFESLLKQANIEIKSSYSELSLFQTDFAKICGVKFEVCDYEKYMMALIEGSENEIVENLAASENIIESLNHKGEKNRDLEQYLIACCGYKSEGIRKRAWKLLNMYYDEHNWQRESALPITIQYIGDTLTISDAAYFHLHFPASDIYSSIFLKSSGQFEYTLTTCGFHDWLAYDDTGKISSRGRTIVMASNPRNFSFHESSVDLVGAEYNSETGDILQSGNFQKFQATLPDFKKQGINWLYLPGVLERPQKNKVSPFACTNRNRVCAQLGGEEAFSDLVSTAKSQDIRLITDCFTRISSSEYHRKYSPYLMRTVNLENQLEIAYGCEGKALSFKETALLNYRDLATWDLLISETLEFLDKFNVDGIMIDNAHICPNLLEVNENELYKKDTDGEYHYSIQERFLGSIVSAKSYDTNHENMPSPLLFKLTKALWKKFPKMMIFGDMGPNDTGKTISLVASGVIPRSYGLLDTLATVFGKRLELSGLDSLEKAFWQRSERNGNVQETETQDVCILMDQRKISQEELPQGAVIIESSSGYSLPNPILLFGKGVWVALDVLRLMPDASMSFIQEQEGNAHRLNLAHWCAQDGQMTRSVSGNENMKQVQERNRQYNNVFSKPGFDFSQLSQHYEHRCSIQNEREVLRSGKFVPLAAYLNGEPHKDVMAFSRFTDNETAIFVLNLRNYPVSGTIELTALKDEYTVKNVVFSLGDFFVEGKDETYFFEEIFAQQKTFSLDPFASQWWYIAPSDLPTKEALDRSFERLKILLDNWSDTSQTYLGRRIQIAVENENIDDLANILGIAYSKFFSKEELSLHKFVLINKTIQKTLVPQLFALTESIASSRGVENDAILAARSITEPNSLGPIVFATPEIGKWSTAGGLGVMVDELSLGLAELGEDVWVISPYYDTNRKGESDYLGEEFKHVSNLRLNIGREQLDVGVFHGVYRNVNLIFLHRADTFPKVYAEMTERDRMRQLSLMGKATLEVLCQFEVVPSILVTNDWFTGLVPAYSKSGFFGDVFKDTKFVHICHNMNPAYEGRIYPERHQGTFSDIHNLPDYYLTNREMHHQMQNPSRCALIACDQWTTVSPSYRNELMRESPLADLLRQKPDPFAFNNGIPKRERFERLPNGGDHFLAKAALQKKYFDYEELDDSVPVFGFVGRITEQKGVHLILAAAEGLIKKYEGKIQLIVGGPGNPIDPYAAKCSTQMHSLRKKYPQSFWAAPDQFFMDLGLNCGADFCMMPSAFEPGGIVQHEFFVGYTPVIAFKTGGLKDTVWEFNPTELVGNGFNFNTHNEEEFSKAVDRAIVIFRQPELYARLRENAYDSVIDVSQVSRAWNTEFYRLKNKIFVDPEIAKEYRDSAPTWNSQQYDSTLPENLAEAVSSKRLKYGAEYREVEFSYQFPGKKLKSVQISGSFDKWQIRHPLEYNPISNNWCTKMHLLPAVYEYKFLIDGSQWSCNSDERKRDTKGIYLNVKEVN